VGDEVTDCGAALAVEDEPVRMYPEPRQIAGIVVDEGDDTSSVASDT
jgi:hypothetical protein